MSLEPHWFSSIFGVLIAASQILPALRSPLSCWPAGEADPCGRSIGPGLWNDLGNLMLAFVMVWAYISYFAVLPDLVGQLAGGDDLVHQTHRGGLGVDRLDAHSFLLRHAFCLASGARFQAQSLPLVWAAGLVLFMHLMYQHWLVKPAFWPVAHGSHSPSNAEAHASGFHWMDLPALVGIGGIWLAFFFWRLPARTLLPLNDPAMHEEAAHHA